MQPKRIMLGVLAFAMVSAIAYAQGFGGFREVLIGHEEVPSVSTGGEGQFTARIRRQDNTIDWQLRYADLESTVTQAHIHLGQKDANGGISVFLCTNLGNGPAGIQACPASPGVISGVITATDVSPNIAATSGARGQGLNTGEFTELVAAMRAGVTYVNVHTVDRPGGEIRSQIGERDDDEEKKKEKDDD